MTKKIIKLNASALRESSCLLRLYLNVIEGYSSKSKVIDIEYGSAFHRFTQALAETGGDEFESMSKANQYFRKQLEDPTLIIPRVGKGSKAWMTLSHLTGTCDDFYNKVWNGDDKNFQILKSPKGNPLVEQTFSIPFYSDDTVDVLIEGTLDAVAKYNGGCYVIPDYKTTSTWMPPEDYFRQYTLSSQLITYYWAVRQHGKLYPDSFWAEICRERIGCVIQGVFLSSTKQTEFHRSPVIWFNEDMLNEYEHGLKQTVERLVYHVKFGIRPHREGLSNGACTYGGKLCGYTPACSAPDEESFKGILDVRYQKQEYDPLRNKE
jgi:hypothetical protein